MISRIDFSDTKMSLLYIWPDFFKCELLLEHVSIAFRSVIQVRSIQVHFLLNNIVYNV